MLTINHWNKKLMTAVRKNDLPLLKDALTKGAQIDYKEDGLDVTPLMLAARYGYINIVDELISQGADVNATMQTNHTALMHATRHSHLECMDSLIEAGANLNMQTNGGNSALSLAVYIRDLAAVEKLLNAGADIECTDEDGVTPLDWAARHDQHGCVNLLVAAGANTDILKNKYGGIYDGIISAHKHDEKTNPYTAINPHIVMKYQGRLPNVGDLRQVFNFQNKTVTELVNETLGPAQSFKTFEDDPAGIIDAYDWMVEQGYSVHPPFSLFQRRINKR